MNKEQFITVTNGDSIPISGSGNIMLESSIELKDVLYVPQLVNSVIFIQKLTKDLNFSITFLSFYCIFYDLAMRKMVLIAKVQSELYVLESKDPKTSELIRQRATTKTLANSEIWLPHRRFGHPSFSLIKSSFFRRFTKESAESFKCDIC